MLNTEPQVTPAIPLQSEPLVTLSEAAASKLQELVAAEQNADMGLRVYVYSGGCSGYRYGMMLEDQPSNEDVRVQSRGINVYIDPQSTQYITGSEIDYLDTLMGAGFTVNNPNAVSACGCGSSFRTADSAGSPGGCSH
jgi:iron-sulfur cluster assembly protein